MDVSLFIAVLWRAKRLVLAGTLLAVVLAVLAYGQPTISGGHPSIKPRGKEVWQSESQLLITQAQFPYRQPAEAAAEPTRQMGALSPVYANLANGNAVQAEIHRQFGKAATVKASEDIDLAASSFLPFVDLAATAPTGAEASRLARGAASILQGYVEQQQVADSVPPNRRIQLAIVESASTPKLTEGHKLSIPLLVFIAVLVATLSIVFLRENLGPRVALALQAAASEQPAEEKTQALPAPAGARADAPSLARPEGVSTNGAHDDAVDRDPVMSGGVEW